QRGRDTHRVSLLALFPEQCAVSDPQPLAAPAAVCPRRCACNQAGETPPHAQPLSLPPGGYGALVGGVVVVAAPGGCSFPEPQSPKTETEDARSVDGLDYGRGRA